MNSKKIYLLTGNDDEKCEFASFISSGTFLHKNICDKCLMPIVNKPFHIEPYQIEWEDGSDIIGDFNYDFYNIVINEKVKKYLQEKEVECNLGKIEILPPESKKKKVKRVEYPYKGPNLYLLTPKKSLNLDIEKTGLKVKLDCKKCGNLLYHFKMDGVIIPNKNWNGEKIFKINQFGSIIYITEDFLKDILPQNFSNFGYKEAGIIEYTVDRQ